MGMGVEAAGHDIVATRRRRRPAAAAAVLLAEGFERRALDEIIPRDGHDHLPRLDEALVILIGRIAAAPETRHAGETAITSFTLVTDRPKLVDGKTVKNEAGYTETLAEFHRVTAFNGLGTSVAKHKKKGDLVEVQGRLHYSKWTDREGVERYAVEIVAEEVLFL